MPGYAKWLLIIVSVILGLFILARFGVFSGKRPANLGVSSGKLAACPATPNCVSTQASDQEHAIEPLLITGTAKQAHDNLMAIIEGMPRTNIVTNDPGYIYVEFKTAWMGYTDDVEFWIDEPAGVIHFRSASRLGAGDLGLNRRRMEAIRQQFEMK